DGGGVFGDGQIGGIAAAVAGNLWRLIGCSDKQKDVAAAGDAAGIGIDANLLGMACHGTGGGAVARCCLRDRGFDRVTGWGRGNQKIGGVGAAGRIGPVKAVAGIGGGALQGVTRVPDADVAAVLAVLVDGDRHAGESNSAIVRQTIVIEVDQVLSGDGSAVS